MRAARFTVITPECIRLEYSADGRFVDEPSLVAAARVPGGGGAGGAARVVAQGDGPQTIDTGRIRLDYAPDGRPFHWGNLRARVRAGDGGEEVEWRPGMAQRGNLGGAMASLDGVRGRVALPEGLLSRDGWYLLDDSRTPLLVDGWVRERGHAAHAGPTGLEAGGAIDWYLFGYGRDYEAALRALGAVGGSVPMPRRVMLGSWYSRYWAYTSEQLREVAAGYDREGFPLDVMVLDMDWHRPPPAGSGLTGWTGWSWNRALLPDAEALLAWLHERGLAVTLNLHPADGVRWYEDRYGAFMRRLGRDGSSRETVPFDAGDRRYMEALLAEVHAPLERDGVDFWWMDWQQEEWAPSVRGLRNVGWLNAVYFAWTGRGGGAEGDAREGGEGRAGGAGVLSVPGPEDGARRGASFGRWGGWGDHRHPVHFSGDVHSGWRALAFVVEFTIRSSHSGCFYWSHDIGGHFGARDEEAMARWVQFGALSAALRVHSARSARLDRRPWTCAAPYARAMRGAYALRSRLMPTIYTAARACHERMRPLIRGMHLDWAGEERAYECTGQYMLGDLLVAPVTEPGVGEGRVGTVEVWFPPGGWWYRLETGERHAGGSEAIVAAAIDEAPVFVRGGVPVVMQQATMRMGSEAMREMTVRCFPGAPGSRERAEVYEDDGITTGYRRGEYARTEVRAAWERGRVRVEIGPASGSYAGQVERRGYVVEVGAASGVRGARVDGRDAAAVEFDAANGVARVRAGERGIRERVVVEVEYREADAGALRAAHRARRVALAASPSAPADRMLAIETGIGVHADADGRGYHFHDSDGLIEGGDAEVAIVDRVGREEAERWRGRVRVQAGVEEWIAAPRSGEGGEELAEPPLGLGATRLVRAWFRLRSAGGGRGGAASLETPVATRLRPLRAWRVVGPFAFDHARTIDEQRAGPEQAATDPSARYEGIDGRVVGWRRAEGSERWTVDLRRFYAGGGIMAYGVTHVWSPVAQASRLVLESGDRMEAWVNREKVFSMDEGDVMEAAAGVAPVRLEAGWNRVAVKVSEGGGGFGFTAALDGEEAVREAVEPE